jgi:hypothetical protein
MESTIKYISVWLFIFIVGGLIINLLIEPQTFDSFKESIQKIKESISGVYNSKSNGNLTVLYGDSIVYPCSMIGRDRRNVCQTRCGFEDLEYAKYKCVRNALNCYCKNG